MPNVLIVDDDTRIRDLLCRYLGENGFVTMPAKDAAQAKEMSDKFEYDALIVDVMMPGQNGFEFVKEFRSGGSRIPVIMLTALGEIDDRIEGLECGADDYLPKPFEPKELVLRLQAILRRTFPKKRRVTQWKIGDYLFDSEAKAMKSGDEKVVLTDMDVKLLRALAAEAGTAVSREELARKCDVEAQDRSIDVQITRLRKKIEEDTKAPQYLQTVRGKGYLLRAEAVYD